MYINLTKEGSLPFCTGIGQIHSIYCAYMQIYKCYCIPPYNFPSKSNANIKKRTM